MPETLSTKEDKDLEKIASKMMKKLGSKHSRKGKKAPSHAKKRKLRKKYYKKKSKRR